MQAINSYWQPIQVYCCVDDTQPDEFECVPWEAADVVQNEEVQDTAISSLVGPYQVKLNTKGDPLGLELETTTSGLMIKAVRDGPVKTHNVCSSDVLYVYRHDFIVRVNDRTHPEEMLKLLKTDWFLKLDMVHPKTLTVKINTNIAPLGLELHSYDNTSMVFEVKKIQEGAVKRYNDQCKEDLKKVENEDQIIAVNDISGNLMTMYKEMNGKKLLDIDLLRVRDLERYVEQVAGQGWILEEAQAPKSQKKASPKQSGRKAR